MRNKLMSPRFTHRLAVVAAAVMCLGLVACSSESDSAPSNADTGSAGDSAWQEVIKAAQQEGEVTIYSGQSTENLDELAKRFDDTYGITVNIVRDNDANLQTKLAAEETTGRGVADVISTATLPWVEEKQVAGYYAPVFGPAFDDKRFDREKFMTGDSVFVSSAGVLTYGWNTDRLERGLSGYEDLLDPELAGGKIGTVLPVSSAVVEFYEYLQENVASDFLEKLAAQKPRTYPGSQAMGQALTSGELAASTFTIPLTSEKEDGAPVDSGVYTPTFGAFFYSGVLTDAPHPNAAQLLANFIVTPAGQEAIAHKAASVLQNIDGAVVSADKIWTRKTPITTAEIEAFRVKFDQLFSSSS